MYHSGSSRPDSSVTSLCRQLGHGDDKSSPRYHVAFRNLVNKFRKDYFHNSDLPLNKQRFEDTYSPEIQDCAQQFLTKYKDEFEDFSHNEVLRQGILKNLRELMLAQDLSQQKKQKSMNQATGDNDLRSMDDHTDSEYHNTETDAMSDISETLGGPSTSNGTVKSVHSVASNSQRFKKALKDHLDFIYPLKKSTTNMPEVKIQELITPNKRWPRHALSYMARFQHEQRIYNLWKKRDDAILQVVESLGSALNITASAEDFEEMMRGSKIRMDNNATEWTRNGFLERINGTKLRTRTSDFDKQYQDRYEKWLRRSAGNSREGHRSIPASATRQNATGTAEPHIAEKLPGSRKRHLSIEPDSRPPQGSNLLERVKRRRAITAGAPLTPSAPSGQLIGESSMTVTREDPSSPDLYNASTPTSPSILRAPQAPMVRGSNDAVLCPYSTSSARAPGSLIITLATKREPESAAAAPAEEPQPALRGIETGTPQRNSASAPPQSATPQAAQELQAALGGMITPLPTPTPPPSSTNNPLSSAPVTSQPLLYLGLDSISSGRVHLLASDILTPATTVQDFFALACTHTGFSVDSVLRLTLQCNWKDRYTYVVQRSASEESWTNVKEMIEDSFDRGKARKAEWKKFCVWVEVE